MSVINSKVFPACEFDPQRSGIDDTIQLLERLKFEYVIDLGDLVRLRALTELLQKERVFIQTIPIEERKNQPRAVLLIKQAYTLYTRLHTKYRERAELKIMQRANAKRIARKWLVYCSLIFAIGMVVTAFGLLNN